MVKEKDSQKGQEWGVGVDTDQTLQEGPCSAAEGPAGEQRLGAKEEPGTSPENAEDAARAEDGELGSEVGELKGALAAVETEKEELLRRLQRVQADFENYRRRMNKEREELVQRANEGLLLELLPVIDSLERALQVDKDESNRSLVEGVELIYRQFMDILKKEGVQPIEAEGNSFDPERHEAVMQVEVPETEEGTVVEELRKGYILYDKVLRPSMVKVAR